MPYSPLLSFGRATFIAFADNQLTPSSIGISPLSTSLPRFLQQSRVRSSLAFFLSCSSCSWIDHLVSGPIWFHFSCSHFAFFLSLFTISLANPLYKRYTIVFFGCFDSFDFRFSFTLALLFFSSFTHVTCSLSVFTYI